MNALACKSVKICGKGCNKGFTFTGFHFGNTSLMKNDTADKLYVKVAQTDYTVRSLTANRKCVGKNIVKCFAVSESFFKDRSLSCKLLIAHLAVLGAELVDFVYCFLKLFYFLL